MVSIMSRRIFSVFILFIAINIINILNFLRYSIVQGKTYIQPAFSKSLLNSYQPQTGDIVIMHYTSHGMMGIPVAEHWPTHAGFVWVQENGETVVLECTKFSAHALPNILKQTKDKERGVRAVPWKEYVNAVDNVMYLRKLIEGKIDTKNVETVINEWAVNIDFETRIADSMTLDLTVAIGFVPVWPKLSEWCAQTAKLHEVERRSNQAYCSEFVVKLLQKLKAIDANYKELYRVSPASLLQSVGVLDKLAQTSELKTKWGEDCMIVRRT